MNLKVNDRITIGYSVKLAELKLHDLVGETGAIQEKLTSRNRKNKGFIISLDTNYLKEKCWFIPEESIQKI